jgi:hypothetical protein
VVGLDLADGGEHGPVQARTAGDYPRLKIRLTVHTGLLRWTAEGWKGDALRHVARLDAAEPIKEMFAQANSGLALILSQQVFDNVIGPGFGRLPVEAFQKVEVRVKETKATAWVHRT